MGKIIYEANTFSHTDTRNGLALQQKKRSRMACAKIKPAAYYCLGNGGFYPVIILLDELDTSFQVKFLGGILKGSNIWLCVAGCVYKRLFQISPLSLFEECIMHAIFTILIIWRDRANITEAGEFSFCCDLQVKKVQICVWGMFVKRKMRIFDDLS